MRPKSLVKKVCVFLASLPAMLAMSASAAASPIYVYKEPSGSIRFSNVPPPNGVEAKVFTARSPKFSLYKVGAVKHWARPMGARLFPNNYEDLIRAAAKAYGIDVNLIKAVIHAESGFNPWARSPKGASGLMQLMPETAQLMKVANIYHPQENIMGGAKFLAILLRRFNGNVSLAVAGYNAGPEAVDRYNGVPPYAETRDYVRRVLALRNKYVSMGRG